MEQFKQIPHRPDFEVSKNGIVRNIKTKEILKEQKTPDGYCVVYIKDDTRKFPKERIHKLVYETFNGVVPSGKEIDHIDGNKQNNILSNLSAVTHKENMKRAVKNKLINNNREMEVLDIKTNTKTKISSVVELESITGIDSGVLVSKIKNSKNNPILDRYVVINKGKSFNTIINNGGKTPVKIKVTNLNTNKSKVYNSISSAAHDTGMSRTFFHRRLKRGNPLKTNLFPFIIEKYK